MPLTLNNLKKMNLTIETLKKKPLTFDFENLKKPIVANNNIVVAVFVVMYSTHHVLSAKRGIWKAFHNQFHSFPTMYS